MQRLLVLLIVMLVGRVAHAGDVETIWEAAPGCPDARARCFSIRLHIAGDDHGPVANREWVLMQLAAANKHFAPLDVGYQLAGIDQLPASAMHVETRADRNALAKNRLTGQVIHVFVVGQLDDVDKDDTIAYGVTWRLPRDPRKYIIISVQALERTLAHELGHFFGLPHSTHAISIMNKTERKEPPLEQRTFADVEIAAMRPVLERLVRNKVIVAVPPR
ncbi:MAG TPA: matrixin family metalloprotease [Kofleriaceae bacterium]